MSKEKPERAWHFYLDDMIGFCGRVQAFTENCDQHLFVNDTMRFDATLRNIELIGEAATHIPQDIRASSPQIPWRMIIAVRNQLIHGYLGIDNDTVWSIIKTDIPVLLQELQLLKEKVVQ